MCFQVLKISKFKNHHFVKRCGWVFFTKLMDYKMSKIWLLKLRTSFLRKWLIKNKQKMLSKQRKHQIVCPLFLSKSSVLRIPNVISEKIFVWHQLMMVQLIRKDVERKQMQQILYQRSSSKSSLWTILNFNSGKTSD